MDKFGSKLKPPAWFKDDEVRRDPVPTIGLTDRNTHARKRGTPTSD
jgi:hypothetical protein